MKTYILCTYCRLKKKMAKASTSAQHYLDGDNCEENPATFLCKACEGRLCEPCKINHEKKKITRNHEILPLTSKNEEMLDILLCPNHAKKKLECYCTRCSEAVCTDCIIKSHNGHSVKSLSEVYKELEDCSKRRKEKIEKSLLPKYRDLLAKEKEKRSAFTKRANEIQTTIDAYTQRVIERVKQISQQSVASLRNAEEDGLKEMDKFMDSIVKTTQQLQNMSKKISANMEAKPHSSMFKSKNSHGLKSFQTLPSPNEYTLTDFQPQQMNLENMFGKPSVLNIGCSQKKNSFVSYILKLAHCYIYHFLLLLPTFTTFMITHHRHL